MDTQVVVSLIGLIGSLVQAAGTICGAIIVGVAGALISGWYTQKRDQQDKEAQWRQHAIELTKLDLERKLKTKDKSDSSWIRPSVLDFLANYRDLQELGHRSPAELYNTIIEKRIAKPGPAEETENEKQ